MRVTFLDNKEIRIEFGTAIVLVLVAILMIIGGIAVLATAQVVPAGTVGVVDYFGQVSDNTLKPGFYLINPLKHVEKMSTQTEQYEYKSVTGTKTKEGVDVTPDVSVIWHIDPSAAPQIYRTVSGNYFDTLITPYLMGNLRDKVKEYTAEDMYTGKTTEIESSVENSLRQSLAPRGIVIERVLFRGLVLPPTVTAAIEAKLAEKQAVEQMNFTVQKQKLEAERLITEANGIATANEVKSKSLTPEIIQWEYIQMLKENKNAYIFTGGNTPNLIMPAPGVAKNQ